MLVNINFLKWLMSLFIALVDIVTTYGTYVNKRIDRTKGIYSDNDVFEEFKTRTIRYLIM